MQAGPQDTVLPQLSGIVPQFKLGEHTVIGEQPQRFAVPPPPQVCGEVQPGQVTLPPQPSEKVPHEVAVQVSAVQPQTFEVPPPPQV